MNVEMFYEIPKDVLSASKLIEEYATKHGWKDWCLYGIADRKLVEKQREVIQKAKSILRNAPL